MVVIYKGSYLVFYFLTYFSAKNGLLQPLDWRDWCPAIETRERRIVEERHLYTVVAVDVIAIGDIRSVNGLCLTNWTSITMCFTWSEWRWEYPLRYRLLELLKVHQRHQKQQKLLDIKRYQSWVIIKDKGWIFTVKPCQTKYRFMNSKLTNRASEGWE